LKLAMALPGKNKHYKLAEVQRRHFNSTARLCGYGPDMEQIIGETLANVDGALEDVGNRLPAGFPADVFESIASGMRQSAARMADMPR